MSVYLRDIPLSEARERFKLALVKAGLWRLLGTETIPIDEDATGRVLAEPVWAKISSPHYHAAAMDGFAVRAEDTFGALPSSPLTLSLAPAKQARAMYLDTGDAMPEAFNAVIPIENVESIDINGLVTPALRNPASIRVRSAVTPWSHVRPLGEDIVASQLVLPAGQILRPVDLGAAAAAGHEGLVVARKPRVAILPTGSELVPLGSKLKAGDILEYNSIVLAGQVRVWGGIPFRYPITTDDFKAIQESVEQAAQNCDLILLNAGSSAGAEDYSAAIVGKLGTLLVHGVAVRPGHPVILGILSLDARGEVGKERTKIEIPIIGIPGYPVSAAMTADLFVEPLLAKWIGRKPVEFQTERAFLTRKLTSPGGDDDYIRVAVGKVGDKLLAAPLSRGAGVISSLTKADGLVILPRGIQGTDAGDEVEVRLYRSKKELERSIFCIGSHDMTLDLLAQYLSRLDRRFISANVGSQAGLIALQRGEAHLAGSHLLDPKTGKYNISYIHEFLDGIRVMIFGFVEREQGLIVKRGNPKQIKNLNDLIASPKSQNNEIRFINRQRGAGTRVLLDYELAKMRIPQASIVGYEQEEFTHLGVAAAVASGRADCGLGIPAAAQSLELDFIPLYQETYQLIIPKTNAESELLEPLLVVMKDPSFQKEVMSMPGYEIKNMGILVGEI